MRSSCLGLPPAPFIIVECSAPARPDRKSFKGPSGSDISRANRGDRRGLGGIFETIIEYPQRSAREPRLRFTREPRLRFRRDS
jgi:hypothetical protein